MDFFEAMVVDTSEIDNTIRVREANGNNVPYPIRVPSKNASPLYGDSGKLPDIGEWGVVLHLDSYGREYFWLFSFHDLISNCCQPERGASLDQHRSGGWIRYAENGELELVHATGTYLKIGAASALSSRTRNHLQSGKKNIPESISYTPSRIPPQLLFLRHTWASGSVPTGVDPLDPRKNNTVTDQTNIKNTELTLDASGVMTLTHAGFSFSVDATGNVVVTLPGGKTIQLGDSSGTKALLTEDFMIEFLNHTHLYMAGPGVPPGTPSTSVTGVAGAAYVAKTQKLKAT